MASFNRRDFFKMVGVTGAASLTACDTRTPVENVLPYVVQPEQLKPGLPTFFASTCDGCAAACGVSLRHREGRVVFVAGNTDSTVGQGGVCSRGISVTQEAYDPDQVTAPTVKGAVSDWDTVLGTLSAAVKGGSVAWVGRYRTGATDRLLGDYLGAVGARRVHWEPLGYESLAKASELAYGVSAIPRYDVSGAHTIVSFGSDWLHTWLAQNDHSAGWAAARDPKSGHVAHFYAIEPRLSHTGTRADTWYAPKAGTETGVALALAKLVADKKGSANGAESFLAGIDAGALASAAGLDLGKLTTLADKLAAGPSVVFPGGATTQGVNGTHLALATLVLNHVCGNLGGSVSMANGRNLGPVSSFADVEALLADCAAGKVKTLFVDELDLVFNLPEDVGAAAALAKVENLVLLGQGLGDTSSEGATVLPTGTWLESWGDAEAVLGKHGLRQPGMIPIHDSRGVGDILLSLAKAGGVTLPVVEDEGEETAATDEGVELVALPKVSGGEARADFEASDFYRYVAGHWNDTVFPKAGGSDFNRFWVEALQAGGWSAADSSEEPALSESLPAPVAGDAVSGDALLLYPHTHLFDGRGASRPWLQEIPHPVSGLTWCTWAEMSHATAEKLGVNEESHVTVTSDGGNIDALVRMSKGMQDGAIAVVLGNGHTGGNRYEKGWGTNGFKLLNSAKDPVSGALAYLGQSASAKATAEGPWRRTMKGSEDMDNRPVALNAFVDDVLAKKEDLDIRAGMGAHVVEDPRLVEAGIHDFYPEPEHPDYRFAISFDLDKCTGCGACEAACFSENNISIVGPRQHERYRYMGWIRLDRFWEGEGEHPDVRYLPAVCQQCAHAPCEGVCPVVATYHNVDGLNAMIYNRCVGTRYCANNCPYSSRRFNWHTFEWPESYQLMLNPDVSTREMGVMEKCTFCVQRLRFAKAEARPALADDATLSRITACAEVCPSHAITFGNRKDTESAVAKLEADPRSYQLFAELNTKNGVEYLARLSFTENAKPDHGGGHGDEHADDGHGDEHSAPAAETH
ncbi:MAG: 4Fe-4S dicluster domain-containing protein [Proteobacteria bacterium]|nr:4Fe-4S dicluster domain-containing protein [Pseudomonadota bacterium]MCP4920218.1 4Fe-4S dicluster domain-containing protein [Pseudomonadota bacterium]